MTPASAARPTSADLRALLAPRFEVRLSGILDADGEARGHGRGSNRRDEIAANLAQSCVGSSGTS